MGRDWLSKEPSKVLLGKVSSEQQFTIRAEAASEDPTFPTPHPAPSSPLQQEGKKARQRGGEGADPSPKHP